MSKSQPLIFHSVWYLLLWVLSGVWMVAAVMVFTRLLPPEEYGRYALAATAAGVIGIMAVGWLRHGYIRFFYESPEPREALASLGRVCGVVSLVALLAGGLAGSVLSEAIYFFVAFLFVSQFWFDLTLETIRLRQRPFLYGIIGNLRALIYIGLGVAFSIWSGLGHAGLILAAGSGSLIVSVDFFRQVVTAVRNAPFKPNLVYKWGAYGAPVVAATAMQSCTSAIERYGLAWIWDERATGIYATAGDFAQQSIGMLMSVVHVAVYPFILQRLAHETGKNIETEMRHYFEILILFGLTPVLVLAAAPSEFSAILVGVEYFEGVKSILPIMALSAWILGVKAFYYDLAFLISGKTWRLCAVNAIACSVSLAANAALIPYMGIRGAAAANLIMACAGLSASYVLGRGVLAIPWPGRRIVRSIMPPVLIGAIMATARGTTHWAPLMFAGIVALLGGGISAVLLDAAGMREALRSAVAHWKNT